MLLKEYAPAVSFGTSGLRALVADLNGAVVSAYARAFVQALRAQGAPVSSCVVGWDLRPSSPAIAAAICAGLEAKGVRPEIAGACPTPALGLRAIATGQPAIAVTGSHIPFDRNGVKFFTARGEITKADESAIASADASGLMFGEPALSQALQRWSTALTRPSGEALADYRARFLDLFAPDALAGLRVGVYEHSAVGRDLLTGLLRDLGSQVVSLARSDSFVPIDTEVVLPEDEARARAWCAEHRLDAVVSTDGDGDRPWICDERGAFLRGDAVGVIAAQRLGATAVATPVSSNTMLEKCDLFTSIARTRIGSPFVIEAMETLAREARSRVAGYEANGGFLTQTPMHVNGAILSPLPTRDSVLPILLVLTCARERGVPVSALIEALPARRTASGSIKGIATGDSAAFIARLREEPESLARFLAFANAPPMGADATDGLRVELASGDIVHLRPSGNAPEFRCYVETADQASADALLTSALANIGAAFGLAR
ncbi:MAG: phosphomannomutase [Beijerinckiaceae bacterium]|nr:phosphomannomutase [Beijerinckiaceae bacterium]